MKKTIFLIFTLILLSSIAYAALLPSTDPQRFEGNVTVDGTLAAAGVNVRVYNGANYKETTTDASGNYILTAEGTDGDTLTFKVYGVAIGEGTQTFSSYAVTDLDATMTRSGSGGACIDGETWSDEGCSGSLVCCSDNTCKSSCGSSSTSSGGGGGGGFTDYEEDETAVYGTIGAGETVTREFGLVIDTPIYSVSITATDTITAAELTVGEGSSPSSSKLAIADDLGIIYDYIEITKTSLTNDDIKEAEIKFKIPKSWFEEKGTDPDTVVLKRWTGSSWEALSTSGTESTSSYYKYSAETPGFSIFAITAKYKEGGATTTETEEETVETTEETTEEADTPTAEEPEEDITPTGVTVAEKAGGSSKAGIGMLIVSIIMVAGIIFYYVGKKKKLKPVEIEE